MPGNGAVPKVDQKILVEAELVKNDGYSNLVIRSTTLGMTSAEMDRKLFNAGVTDREQRIAAIQSIQDAKFFKSDLKAADHTKQAKGERKVMRRMKQEGLLDAAGNPTEKYLKVILNSDDGVDQAVNSLTRGTNVSEEYKVNMKARFEQDRFTTLDAKQQMDKNKAAFINKAYNMDPAEKEMFDSMLNLAVSAASAATALGILTAVLNIVDDFLQDFRENEGEIQERVKELEYKEAEESINESNAIIAAGSTTYTDENGQQKTTSFMSGSVFSPMAYMMGRKILMQQIKTELDIKN